MVRENLTDQSISWPRSRDHRRWFGQTPVVKLALIINPTASSVSRRSRVMIEKLLATDHELVVHETSRQRHATRLAHRASREGFDVVLTLGGDGTVNEAANGLLDASDCALAPLPGGSTNVFARALGFPNSAVEATRTVLEALDAGSTRSASVGMAGDRAFLFHVGAGFDAAVVQRVEERSAFKRYAGHPWFIAAALRTWASPERSRLRFDIRTDDGRVVRGAQMAVALNLSPYTFLGNRPLDLAPEVTLTSPLSIVALTSLSARRLLPAARSAIGDDPVGIPNRGATRHWPLVHGAELRSERPFPYQLDGEPQAPVRRLRIEHRPDALQLVVPVDAAPG